MLKCALILLSLLCFHSCKLSTQRVISDPIGYSEFYLINTTSDSVAFRIVVDDSYPNALSDSIFRGGANDTIPLGNFSAFAPPTPTECFDTLLVMQPAGSITIDSDSSWHQITKKADYPQVVLWYYIYPILTGWPAP